MNKWQRFICKRTMWRLVLVSLLAVSFVAGCAGPQQNPYMYQGAGLGALLGAGLGAAVNHNNPWKGAAIGGLLGGAGGGIAGEMYGRSNPSYPPNAPPPQGQGYYQQPYYGQQPGYSYAPPPNQNYY